MSGQQQGVSLAALRSAGLFAMQDFLSETVCAELCASMESGASLTATVARAGRDHVLDTKVRRTRGALLPASLRSPVEAGLAAMRPQLAEHFAVELGDHETPQFLAYSKGDFFRAHQDNSEDPTLAEFIRRRRVSVVVFLSRQTRFPEPGSHCGGELTFFQLAGLAGDAGLRARLWGQPGLLVAFDSRQLHEVAPVTHGFRASMVTWYPAP
jgi:SM-20-related protein